MYLLQAPCHEDILGEWRQFHTFLTLALDGDECSASRFVLNYFQALDFLGWI